MSTILQHILYVLWIKEANHCLFKSVGVVGDSVHSHLAAQLLVVLDSQSQTCLWQMKRRSGQEDD